MQIKLLATFTLVQALSACTTRNNNETPDSSVHDVLTSLQKRSVINGKAVGTAVSLRDKLYAPFKTCNVPNGTDVKIAHFQDGFFKAKKPTECASLSGDSAWIHAGSVDVPRNSYGGLRELNSNSAVTVAMNYADNKIFCTSGKCLINSALYAQNRCFLRDAPARALQNAAIDLQKRKGASWKLRALDCYRPAYVQERMWDLVRNPQWVSKLDRVAGNFSKHNRGLAADLTLEVNGTPVDMGSGFDEFTARSNYNDAGITSAQRANRVLLRNILSAAGFTPYDGEWWHFSWAGSDAALDIPL